jgi:trehalose 6-phosphate synthase/phosphatase
VERDEQSVRGLRFPKTSGVTYRGVALSARDVAAYYGGFSNRTIWPLFHYFVGHTQIDADTWRIYERVNERFARLASETGGPSDLVWIHDYQLLRAPYHLRALGDHRPLAFFLHIPFPAYDVFRILPWARPVLRGMLAADLIGVHVPEYADHLLTCAERLLGCEVDRAAGVVEFEGRRVAVQAHAIGIDADRMEALATRAEPEEEVALVVGIDRLDYTKGVHERLLAVERFFDRYPAFRRRVSFTQLLVPSRERVAEYQALKREIDETVGRINGRFSEAGWAPIRYMTRSLDPAALAALYRNARVALVTPLRDGMNLVAKEFVAAQVDDPGVLVLSELAGAADELQEALLVNPFDIDAVADALNRALTMPEDERLARMSALRDRVRKGSVHNWVKGFLQAAETAIVTSAGPIPTAERVRRRLAPWLAGRRRLSLFLDYDGTLTPIVRRPEEAVLSDAARRALQDAARSQFIDVVIVSGRGLADLERLVDIAGLIYVGNHGFEARGPGFEFHHHDTGRYAAALTAAVRRLERLEIAGAHVEPKGASLSYHVREMPVARREAAMRRAGAVLARSGLRVTYGRSIVEGRPPVDWDKGRAVLHVLVRRHGADWPSSVRALYIGDDTTDEDAFRSLRGIGRSIRVGPSSGPSLADYSLPDPDAVLQLLRWLSAGAFTGEGAGGSTAGASW